jgi:hypothetical protein
MKSTALNRVIGKAAFFAATISSAAIAFAQDAATPAAATQAKAEPVITTATVTNRASDFTQYLIAKVEQYAVPVIGAIIFLIVAWVVAAWVGRLVARSLERAKVERTLSQFFSSVARYSVLVLAGIACLGIFSVEITGFAVLRSAWPSKARLLTSLRVSCCFFSVRSKSAMP